MTMTSPKTDVARGLLIEDSHEDADLVIRACRKGHLSCDVTHATSLLDATRYMGQDFEFVLLDLSLPDSDGLSTLSQVVAHCDAPVIVLTGRSEPNLGPKAIAAGAHDFVQKDRLSQIDLNETIGHAIARHRVTRDLLARDENQECSEDHGVWHWTRAPRLLYLSPRAKRTLGLVDMEVTGEQLWSQFVHPDDASNIARELRRLLRDGDNAARVEARVLGRDGRYRHVDVTGRVIRDESGAVTGSVGTVLDVTLQRRAENELLALISRKLRAPLDSLFSSLAVLADGVVGPISDEQKSYLENATGNANHLGHMLRDLGELARMSTEGIDVIPVPTDAISLVDDVVATIAPQAATHGIHVERSGGVPGQRVMADSIRIRQVLTNLLQNAVRHSREGMTVTVTIDTVGPQCRFDVVDQGPGVPADVATHMFERFHQADDGRPSNGSLGLGLHISRLIVRRHGGDVWYKSEAGSGSVFSLSLPIR